MTYEEKTKLLEIFNAMNWDRPWSDDYHRKFMADYQALAAAMAQPILDSIDNSELRKSIKVIKQINKPIVVPPGTKCLAGFGYWDEPYIVGEDGLAKTITAQAAAEVRLGKVTPEAVEKMMRQVAKAIVGLEIEAVNILKDMLDTDDITMYVRQDYIPYDDPTLIKRQHIGIFGWEEFAVVAHD